MGNLIQDNQRDKANATEPDLSQLPKSTVAPSQSEQGATSAASPFPAPLVDDATAEYAPIDAPEAQVDTSEPLSAVPPPPPAPATPGASAPIVPELPSLFEDVTQTSNLSPYSPEVINTRIPTVYVTTPDLSGTTRARRSTESLIKFQEMEEERLRQQELASQRQPAIQQTPNTTNIDKPWYRTGAIGFLGDVLFGNEQSRAATEQGRYNPLAGEFGRQGAGLGGALKYTLGLTANLPAAVVADAYKGANIIEDKTGFDVNTVLDWVPGLSAARTGVEAIFGDRKGRGAAGSDLSFFRYNPEADGKETSSVLGAIVGDEVADVGDPKASTTTGTGRVFYNPRRNVGDPVWKDPVGLGAEVALNILNPIDNLNPVSNAIGTVIGAGVAAVVRKPKVAAVNKGTQTVLQPSNTALQEIAEGVGAGNRTILQNQPATEIKTRLQPSDSPTYIQAGSSQLAKDFAIALEETTQVMNWLVSTSGRATREDVDNVLRILKENNLPAVPANIELAYTGKINERLNDTTRTVLQPSPTVLQPNRVQKQAPTVLAAEETNLLPAAQSTQIPRVYKGSDTVIQSKLPPAIDPALLPPANYKVILDYDVQPSKVVFEIGLGKPSSTPITEIGELRVRPHQEIVQQLEVKNPSLLEGYEGKNVDDLVEHVSKKDPKLDPTQFNTVVSSVDNFDNVKLPIQTGELKIAAQELAGHKVIIGETLSKLDDLFDNTVDFGRKFIDEIEPRVTNLEDTLTVITNNGKPNLLREAWSNQSRLIREALESNDWESLNRVLKQTGQDPTEFVAGLVDRHNRLVSEPVAVANINPRRARTFDVPKQLYHGSALADWEPGYNVRLRGSRGELGYGQYYTLDPTVAEQYALARVAENVNSETLEKAIVPAVNEVSHKYVSTLDANVKLPSTSEFFKDITVGLPPKLQQIVRRALGRTKNNTYNSLLTKIENNLVKAGLEPTEETLVSVQRIVSDNLRNLGYDSVIDKKSGFFLGLTSEGTAKVGQRTLEPADAMKAATARYNADAYAAKYYPSRLTTAANLQDSTYKVYSQLHEKVDNKLAEVQQELINRLADQTDGVLPKVDLYPELTARQPKSVAELLDEVNAIADDICGA